MSFFPGMAGGMMMVSPVVGIPPTIINQPFAGAVLVKPGANFVTIHCIGCGADSASGGNGGGAGAYSGIFLRSLAALGSPTELSCTLQYGSDTSVTVENTFGQDVDLVLAATATTNIGAEEIDCVGEIRHHGGNGSGSRGGGAGGSMAFGSGAAGGSGDPAGGDGGESSHPDGYLPGGGGYNPGGLGALGYIRIEWYETSEV